MIYNWDYCQNCCYRKYINIFWPIRFENLMQCCIMKINVSSSGFVNCFELKNFWQWYWKKSSLEWPLNHFATRTAGPHTYFTMWILHNAAEISTFCQFNFLWKFAYHKQIFLAIWFHLNGSPRPVFPWENNYVFVCVCVWCADKETSLNTDPW